VNKIIKTHLRPFYYTGIGLNPIEPNIAKAPTFLLAQKFVYKTPLWLVDHF
jgi:hypothetical protein